MGKENNNIDKKVETFSEIVNQACRGETDIAPNTRITRAMKDIPKAFKNYETADLGNAMQTLIKIIEENEPQTSKNKIAQTLLIEIIALKPESLEVTCGKDQKAVWEMIPVNLADSILGNKNGVKDIIQRTTQFEGALDQEVIGYYPAKQVQGAGLRAILQAYDKGIDQGMASNNTKNYNTLLDQFPKSDFKSALEKMIGSDERINLGAPKDKAYNSFVLPLDQKMLKGQTPFPEFTLLKIFAKALGERERSKDQPNSIVGSPQTKVNTKGEALAQAPEEKLVTGQRGA